MLKAHIFIGIFLCTLSCMGQSGLRAIKPPIKDLKRLSLIPSRPPTRLELTTEIRQSIGEVQKGLAPATVKEVNTQISTLPIETIHRRAIAEFYSSDQKKATLMMLQLASQIPDSLLVLNNVGAMLNIAGMEERAVRLFQYCMEKVPHSSIILSNIGQSFLGLGDLLRSAAYLRQCLEIDSLNIEANHSMGMLNYFKKDYDAAMRYFERELSVAHRNSTMAMAYRMGKRFNLRALAAKRQARRGIKAKDHLEEITLGKFSLPKLPQSTREILVRKTEWYTYTASVSSEQFRWMGYANQISMNYTSQQGEERYGVYSELASAMLDELNEEFTSEYLESFNPQDFETIRYIIESKDTLITNAKCPPSPAGSSLDVQEAFAIKCCEELQRPVADALVSSLMQEVSPIVNAGQQRWKSYINQLVAIVELDPSPGNQALVYHAVSGYFAYLIQAASYFTAGEINNLLVNCRKDYNANRLDSIITSNNEWRLKCPPWLNVEVDLETVVMKVDCNKLVFEAGEGLMGAYEHEFKSGKSTLLLGPGAKASFFGLVTAEAKSQAFISFDNNGSFADLGIKHTAEVSVSGTPLPLGGIRVGGNLMGIEVSTSAAINAGFTFEREDKGLLNIRK